MSEQQLPPVFDPPPVTVLPKKGSRLAALHAAYADAKARADAAAAELKAVTDGIKLELSQQAPEARKVDLTGPTGPTLRLAYAERVTFDSTRLKREAPEVYVRYAKFGGAWSLRQVKDGDA